jgi:hypothetical protein
MRTRARTALAVALVAPVALLAGCGAGDAANVPAPTRDELGLDAKQAADYDPVTLDELVTALDGFDDADDSSSREDWIHRHDHRWVGWVGVVVRTRAVSHAETAVTVSPPGGGLLPTTVDVVFPTSEGDPVQDLGRGDVIRFAGRLEFDGQTRKPWVLDAHLL